MGSYRFHRLLFPLSRLTRSCRRCPVSRRCWIPAAVCALYLGFVASQVGRTDTDRYRQSRGLYNLGVDAPSDSAHSPLDTNFAAPTRSNVVYITLRSKRLKPANIRGTVRPKLRRKARRWAFTQNKPGASHRVTREHAAASSWTEPGDAGPRSVDASRISSIRIYSPRPPPWFSARDVDAMRFLADARVARVREVSRGELPPLWMFEGETGSSAPNRAGGVVHSPADTTEVFAFHLDRVLGLNRTSPAVSRRFRFLHGALGLCVVCMNKLQKLPVTS